MATWAELNNKAGGQSQNASGWDALNAAAKQSVTPKKQYPTPKNIPVLGLPGQASQSTPQLVKPSLMQGERIQDYMPATSLVRDVTINPPQKPLAEKPATISQGPIKKPSLLSQGLQKVLPDSIYQSYARNVATPVKNVADALFPSYSDQMKAALEENPGASIEELNRIVQKSDAQMGLRVDNNTVVDPFGGIGSIEKKGVGALSKWLTKGEARIVEREGKNIIQIKSGQAWKTVADEGAAVRELEKQAPKKGLAQLEKESFGSKPVQNVLDEGVDVGQLRKGGLLGQRLDPEKRQRIFNDIEKAKTYDFQFKVGDKVQTEKGRVIVNDRYIENGEARYVIYPPGKKTSYGYHTWVPERDLSPRTETPISKQISRIKSDNVTVDSNIFGYTKNLVKELADANPENRQLGSLLYGLRNFEGDISKIINEKERRLIDRYKGKLATEDRQVARRNLEKAKKGTITANIPTRKLSRIDQLIADGKVRVVFKDGRDVYQIKKNGQWVNVRDEDSAIKQVTKKAPLLANPAKRQPVLPQALEEKKLQLEIAQEALDNDPAKDLLRYTAKTGENKGSLREVTGQTKGKFAKSEEELLDAQRIIEDTQGQLPEAEVPTTKITDLLEEAKKYKSAEEFATSVNKWAKNVPEDVRKTIVEKSNAEYETILKKADDFVSGSKENTTFYHGTPYEFEQFKKTQGLRKGVFDNKWVDMQGFFFTRKKDVAQGYIDMWTREAGRGDRSKTRIIETRLKFNNPIDFTKKLPPTIKKVAIEELEKYGGSGSVSNKLRKKGLLVEGHEYNFLTDNKRFIETLKEEGYDAVYATNGHEVMVFDENQIMQVPNKNDFLKSQLEDIWKQANQPTGSTALLEETKSFKKLSAEGIPLSTRKLETTASKLRPTPVQKEQVRTLEEAAQQTLNKVDPTSQKDIYSLPETIKIEPTSVKKKINALDYLRTPDRVLNKIGMGKEAALLRTQYEKYVKELPKNIETITAWSKRVPKASSERLFDYLDGKAIKLSPEEKKVATEMQEYLKNWADRLNLPEDKRVTNYITHLFDDQLIAKEFDEDLAKIIGEKIPGEVYNPFLQSRLGSKGYKRNVWAALDAYTKRATRKVHMDVALEQIQLKTGASLEYSRLEESQYKYIKSYVDNINMRPTDIDNLIDNTVKQVVGYKFGQRPVTRVTRFLRQMTYRGMLGANLGSAMRNLSQGVNNYAILGEKYTALGYMKLFSPAAKKELIEEGILASNFIEDRTLSSTKKALQKIDKSLWFFFDQAEKINRGAAYHGAKSKAINAGKTEEQAIEYAKKIVRKTQFAYDSVDQPVIAGSDISKTLFQFQTFTTKQSEFLIEMLKDKNFVGLIRYAIAGYVFVNTIGKAMGMEPKELLPLYRFDTPPSLKLPAEIVKAAVDAPSKYGQPRDWKTKMSDIGKAAVGLIPGGIQARKTIQGAEAVREGGSIDKGGRKQFEVGGTPLKDTQAYLFGKYAGEGAKDYFNNVKTPEQKLAAKKAEESKKKRDAVRPLYNEITRLHEAGNDEEVQKLLDGMTDEEYDIYKSLRASDRAKHTEMTRLKLELDPKDAVDYLHSLPPDEAQRIINLLTDEEYARYNSGKQ